MCGFLWIVVSFEKQVSVFPSFSFLTSKAPLSSLIFPLHQTKSITSSVFLDDFYLYQKTSDSNSAGEVAILFILKNISLLEFVRCFNFDLSIFEYEQITWAVIVVKFLEQNTNGRSILQTKRKKHLQSTSITL